MMARMASADIMCLGTKSVRENFTGIIRYVIFLLNNAWKGFASISLIFSL